MMPNALSFQTHQKNTQTKHPIHTVYTHPPLTNTYILTQTPVHYYRTCTRTNSRNSISSALLLAKKEIHTHIFCLSAPL